MGEAERTASAFPTALGADPANMTELLFLDPPDHPRLRGLVNKAFTARVVEQMRPRVQAIVDGILDEVQERGSLDVVADLAYPIPVTVICDLFGVPETDRPQVKAWSL